MLIQILRIGAILYFLKDILACTNIVISPQASTDGSSIIAYNADSAALYGSLYHYPAKDSSPGTMRDVYGWDSGKYLGQIKEAPHTYNVVGNINEFGLIIGETTFGGVEVLQSQSNAKIDYGSLIWITLQRSTNAREAIQTIGALMAEYGYASEGESFSIADPKEAWIMEIIGKGEFELGAVWVARKVPAGHVTSHANQARIRTFPLHDPDTCLYAPDVITFARKIGLYSADQTDELFSFSDIYDAVTFEGARLCEARVWSFFSAVMGPEWSAQYLDYAQGYNLTNRMPLFVMPPADSKLSVQDAMQYMRSHYENSPLDMTGQQFSDVGAYTGSPYRTHPLIWQSAVSPAGQQSQQTFSYLNERPIATPQTGWNFVAQARSWMPRELSGLMWFGVDDSGTTVRIPVYGSATALPRAFAGAGAQDGVTPPMMQFRLDSAFYLFNLVANWAYARWDLISPDLLSVIHSTEQRLQAEVKDIDQLALEAYHRDGALEAVALVTDFTIRTGEQLMTQWFALFGQLFVKYRDGYVITGSTQNPACGCNFADAGYPQQWYDRIVRNTGAHYYVAEEVGKKLRDERLAPVPKRTLKGLR
jgi:dipeptidase